jgi:hypothetical protein
VVRSQEELEAVHMQSLAQGGGDKAELLRDRISKIKTAMGLPDPEVW